MSKTQTNTVTTETVVPETKTIDVAAKYVELKTKSALIRHLSSEGMTTSQINKAINDAGIKMIYQHVRNVLNQKPKKTAV